MTMNSSFSPISSVTQRSIADIVSLASLTNSGRTVSGMFSCIIFRHSPLVTLVSSNIKQQIVQSLWRRDFTSLTESAMVLHAQIQAAAVCCKSQSIPLFGRHAVFRLDVVGDLCILPRTRAQREVALLTAPDIELMADQIRRDARQQIRRLLRVDNA